MECRCIIALPYKLFVKCGEDCITFEPALFSLYLRRYNEMDLHSGNHYKHQDVHLHM